MLRERNKTANRRSHQIPKLNPISDKTSGSVQTALYKEVHKPRINDYTKMVYEKKKCCPEEKMKDIQVEVSKTEDLLLLFSPLLFCIQMKTEFGKLKDLEIKCINNDEPDAKVEYQESFKQIWESI